MLGQENDHLETTIKQLKNLNFAEIKTPKTRLVLTKLILNNFKSYAGNVEIGPFHTSFSSIVGPNGSGKSNVIDSLLFVFGFKAKKLRQGKLADLIHNSKKHPDLNSCSVTVCFALVDNETNSIIPDSDFTISRNVRKTDLGKEASTYYINDKISNYTNVTNLLKSYGVDLDHKRFLILQGEVESIALMKPKGNADGEDGLLEYLEDIIGTSKYAEPIQKATEFLDVQNDVYEAELVKFKHIQRETNSLKDKSQDALEFIEWENNIKILTNKVLQTKRWIAKNEIDALEKELKDFTDELEQKLSNQESEANNLKKLENEVKKMQTKSKELSEKAAEQNKLLANSEKAQIELKETEKFLLNKRAKIAKQIKTEKHDRSEDQTWVMNFDNDFHKAKEDLESLKLRLESEKAILEEIQDSLQDKTQVFQKKIEKKQLELSPYLEKINEISSNIKITKSELEIYENKINAGRIALEKAQGNITKIRETIKEKMADSSESKSFMEAIQNKLKEKKTQQSELEKEIKESKENLSSTKKALDDAQFSIERNKNRGKVHSFLMDKAKSGEIPGICGRLGDLGTIDDKYDIAVTTACGHLDSIVVNTVEDAQKCIEQLKNENIGRATFLCLEKINPSISNINTPENAPRLFDLIRPKDKKYASAFYHALGDTLVSNDLEQGKRIAYGKVRYRVVTLQGQLIDKSGTMTGGGNKVSKGGMSSKTFQEFSESDIKKMKEQILKVSEKIRESEGSKTKIDARVKELEEKLMEVKEKADKTDLELKSLEDEKEDAKAEYTQAQNNLEPDPEDLKMYNEISKTLKQFEVQLEKPTKDSNLIQEEIKILHEEIMSVGGVRLRTQYGKVDSLKDQISTLQKKLAKLKAEKSSKEKNLNKSIGSIDKKEKEMEELDREIEQVQEKFKQSLITSQSVQCTVQEANEAYESIEDSLNELKAQLSVKTSEFNKARSIQMELKGKISTAKTNISNIANRIKQYESEIKGIELCQTGFEELDEEIEQLKQFDVEELETFNLKKLHSELEKAKNNLPKNCPNLTVLKEYKNKMQIYKERSENVEEASRKREELKNEYDRLRKERLDKFMEGFIAISQKLKELYQMITMGGNAELELVDSLDPFSEGVLFSVMPPKKSWKNISNLSGGEKTLSSLALVFALHHFKPTPLYFMDEIDAALDFRNVSIIANYIKLRTKNAQFIIISLRNNMFELADRLVGIYKTENTSKSLSINPHEIVLPKTEEETVK